MSKSRMRFEVITTFQSKLALVAAVLAACGMTATSAATPQPAALPSPLEAESASFRNELEHAIQKGLRWLARNQDEKGFWSNEDHPAVTALALQAFMGEPSGRLQKEEAELIRKGYAYILSSVQPDGSIHRNQLQNYNTAISVMALVASGKSEFHPVIRQARQWLMGQQVDLGEAGELDTPFDGGIGYGSKYQHSDMNNTLTALEALYYSRHLEVDRDAPESQQLNWAAVLHFIQNCQNLPSHNPQDWASGDPKHKGGFVYYPGHSMAGTETNAVSGRVALRSYGSISYGGLLSYMYADLRKDDPRVTAVMDWLRGNWTLEENPGMGQQGLYYYLHLMTKALSTYGVEKFELRDGTQVDWRREVAMRLLALQRRDGSWENDNPRWWEKDPALATAYSLITLEIIYRGI
jgi:squalene-hopene/tetraprenyl-beta-curcumene cyclase